MENDKKRNEIIDDEEEKQPTQRIHSFLLKRYLDGHSFTFDELKDIAKYDKDSTFKTYFSKIMKEFCEYLPDNKIIVTERFRKFAIEDKFIANYSQSRKIKDRYCHLQANSVIIYEFLMPLSNENELKVSLDALFYLDTIKKHINRIDSLELQKYFPKSPNISGEQYMEEIYYFISRIFGGYSISHVSGRFKAEKLMSFDDVANLQKGALLYLIDETTAIVKFIFPVDLEETKQFNTLENFVHENTKQEKTKLNAQKIEFLFQKIFIDTILQLVNCQDEIWLIESGLKTRLHVWKLT